MKTDHLSEFEILDFQHNLLNTEQAAEAERHLRECSMCRARADLLQKQIAELDTLKEPVSVPEPLIAGILRNVRKEKAVKESRFPDLRWFAGVAAAAALLLIILNPQPLRTKSTEHASATKRSPAVLPAMEPASIPNKPLEPDMRQDVMAESPPPMEVAMDIGREEEKDQTIAFAAAPKPSSSTEPRVRVLALSTIAPPADKPRLMGVMRAKKARLGERYADEISADELVNSSAKLAMAAPVEPASLEAASESFGDYTLSKELDGNEPCYLLIVNNTNTQPIHVTLSLSSEDPSLELVSWEPGLLFNANAERAWTVDLIIPPLTNRIVRYQAIQH